jgi:signal transduction histidine kinase
MHAIEISRLLHGYILQPISKVGNTLGFESLFFMLPLVGWLTDRMRRLQPEDDDQRKPSKSHGRELELERQIKQLRSLLRATASLSATLNYERVLEITLDLAASAIEEPGVGNGRLISALMLFGQTGLQIVSARGLTHADLRVELPGSEGVLGEALNSGETRYHQDVCNDPELRRLVGLHACQAAVCIPLVVGMEVYGLLLFAHPNKDFFTADHLETLEAISLQAMIALQNAKLYSDLEQEKERIAEIQEEARKKLARDLHDGPTQSVGAIAMRVNFARRLVQRDANKAAEELYKIEELARRTTKEIRQMLFTLRPLILESEGLVPALEKLAENMRENHDQNVILESQAGVADDLEVGKQGVIFFIIEEAINNARKHAQASHIWVRLNRNQDLLQLEVEDDGAGFDLAAVEAGYGQRGSLGMVNLRERSELVNGVLRIDSAKGEGTRISVTIPATIEAADRLRRAGFVS